MTSAELDSVKAALLSYLQRNELSLTDFEVGGVLRTQLEIETAVVGDLLDAMAVQSAGGYLESSDGDWLEVLAHAWYEIDRALPAVAQQTVTLACAADQGPYVITAANAFTATDGARYLATTFGTLAPGGTLTVQVTAESPGAARGLVSRSEATLPGVTIIGATIGILSGVPQFGADGESDASVAARCAARWPSLEVGDDAPDRLSKWALAASPAVTRIRLDADEVNPGGVVLTLAGGSGGVSPGVVSAVRTYIAERAPITDYITTQSASPHMIIPGGTVTVPAAQLSQIQIAAETAWNAFLAQAQIGGLVYLSQLIKVVMDAGAIDFPNAAFFGTTDPYVTLASNEVGVPSPYGLATLLIWQGV